MTQLFPSNPTLNSTNTHQLYKTPTRKSRGIPAGIQIRTDRLDHGLGTGGRAGGVYMVVAPGQVAVDVRANHGIQIIDRHLTLRHELQGRRVVPVNLIAPP